MRKVFRIFLTSIMILTLLASAVFSIPIKEKIEVYRNFVNLMVNGKSVEVDNFLYEGTIYIPIKYVSQMLGSKVTWDGNSRTLNITYDVETTLQDDDWIVKELLSPVSAYNPVINCKDLNIKAEQIDAFKLEKNNQRISRAIDLDNNNIIINNGDSDLALALNEDYTLKIYMKDNTRYKIKFTSGGLPDITDTGHRKVVFVPAMPEKGFYFPYFLAIPSDKYKYRNQGHKRYLIIDTNNTGVSNDFRETLRRTKEVMENGYSSAAHVAESLWLPMLMPVFPRPDVGYTYKNERNYFYTHALDRDTATLHLKMEDPELASILTEEFSRANFDVNKFYKLDQQLIAMMDHAISYLNKYGHNVETDKVFLCGYSASGTFTDRFATLHPDRVKAVASGATLDDMMLPLSTYKGKNLIFPIGTYDYKEITGRDFDLEAHNSVARLIYMGEDDTNNVVPYNDCYGDTEREIIISLWGLEVLPRAKSLIKLYGESGGKGMFILDRGEKHGSSRDMDEYVIEFFKANRDSDHPVYPIPRNPEQLKYTLYE